jgi:hypothetical protein
MASFGTVKDCKISIHETTLFILTTIRLNLQNGKAPTDKAELSSGGAKLSSKPSLAS